MAKHNPASSSTGDQGEALISLLVSKMGHIWQPAARREVAIDGAIELFTEGRESTSRFLSVQVKTRTGAGGRPPIRLHCNPADIVYWRKADRPVLVVLVDPDIDQAWFVCAQEYFSRESIPDNTIHFDPTADRFDVSISDYVFELASARRGPSAPSVDASPASMVTSRHILHHFLRALSLAISDHRHESMAGPTPLFLDADIAVSGTLPLQTSLARSMDHLRDDHVYSMMLWRLGFLGPGTLLAPHSLEFTNVLHRCLTAPRDDMASLLRHSHTIRSLAEMRLAIRDPDAPVATLMEQLRRIPRETAMLVAVLIQASQPIRSIGQVLTLDDGFPEVTDVASTPVFKQILHAMEQHAPLRHRVVSQRAMLADSVALTMLVERIEQYRSEQIPSVGYFATRTSRIISLLQDERLRHFFEPNPRDHSSLRPGLGSESVFRTSEYLICRSTFTCLRRRESLAAPSSQDAASLSLDAVAACADELTGVLNILKATNRDPHEMFRVERLPMEGDTLAATVDYLKSLASLDTIWLADDARGLRDLCRAAKFSDVENFVINNYTKMVAWTQHEFASRTESVEKWRSAYERFVERRQVGERN